MHPRPGHVLTSVLLGPKGWPTQSSWSLFEATRSAGQNKSQVKESFGEAKNLELKVLKANLLHNLGVPRP